MRADPARAARAKPSLHVDIKELSPFFKWWSSTSSCYILPAHDTSCLWSRVCVVVPEGSALEQHPPIWCAIVQQKMTQTSK